MIDGEGRMDPETYSEIVALEESLWRAETRFDAALMDRTFAPGFFEFGRSGRTYTREKMLAVGDGSAGIDALLPLPRFAARYLTDDVVHVTYVSVVTCDGRREFGNRSSIWSRIDGTWRLCFHQGTPTGSIFDDGDG